MSNMKNEKSLSKNEIKKIIAYSFSFPKSLFWGTFFSILSIISNLIAPYILRDIIDNKLIQENLDLLLLVQMVIFYFIIESAGALFKYFGLVALKMLSSEIVQKIRLEIYDKLQNVNISFFDSTPQGFIVSKITNDTKAIEDLYSNVFGQFFTSFITVVGVILAILFVSPTFAIICIFIVLIFIAIILLSTKYSNRYNYLVREKIGELNSIISEAIQGMSIIRAFNSQKRVIEKFEDVNNNKFNNEIKLLLLESAFSHNIISLIRNFATLLLIYYFGRKFLKEINSVTIGMLYVYMNYLEIMFKQSYGLFEKMPQMQKAIIGAKHIFETLDIEEIEESKEKIIIKNGNVKFENVFFAYKKDEYVLKNINFEVANGEKIGIVGHTGSGKSSIINLLMKFYYPQKGRIKIDDKDIALYSSESVRENIGIVLQEPFLFEGSILDNITLKNANITREIAQYSLEILGGEIVTKNLENGIDEKIIERGSTLSAGQRQLISFARALAYNPKILILDEATSSIDSETEQIIQDAMNILMEGRTTFIIAHRLSTIRNADKIIFLEKGEIEEVGNHNELIEKKGKYYEMYQAQSKIKK